ncbi:heme exporter protein CcmD [Plastoroseomonas hellenica]|uniref:Heme exporter protein D n=1 Tax=Plastoroseomonas hellenica TaxID=2687306 RepID=A0ABS5EYG6_9PROT|nr:heme exporter protein CcmD [Plastoroseomonas hellenica]MBR0644757.1 heme exporter protein CcmD [Plastoroseomonas hellenica]MBR0665273.1 heme exporter protein CcmD [Plastoroseomonas hellenica]
MTLHWWHVTISYGLTLAVFGGLALGAVLRHRAARARLAALDPRA